MRGSWPANCSRDNRSPIQAWFHRPGDRPSTNGDTDRFVPPQSNGSVTGRVSRATQDRLIPRGSIPFLAFRPILSPFHSAGRRFCVFITLRPTGRLRRDSRLSKEGVLAWPDKPSKSGNGGEHAEAFFGHKHRSCRAWRVHCESWGDPGFRKIRISNHPDPALPVGSHWCPGELANPHAHAWRNAGVSGSSVGVDATPEKARADNRREVITGSCFRNFS